MFDWIFGSEEKRNQQLIAASTSGDIDKVRKLLTKKLDVNFVDPASGDTALVIAADRLHEEIVADLIKAGAKVNVVSKVGHTPLLLAANHGEKGLDLLDLLLKAGADPNLAAQTGQLQGVVPMWTACSKGSIRIFRRLKDAGANLLAQTGSGNSLMYAAAMGGSVDIISSLKEAGVDTHDKQGDGSHPIHVAATTGHLEAVRYFLTQGAGVDALDADGATPLLRAVLANQADIARLLVQSGANVEHVMGVSPSAISPLFVAATRGFTDVVRVLIDAGADPEAKLGGEFTVLALAKQANQHSTGGILMNALKKKKSVIREAEKAENEGRELLDNVIRAIGQKDLAEVTRLAKSKRYSDLPPDIRLLVACAAGDPTQVADLLRIGANPNNSSPDVLGGFTPLVFAVGVSRSVEVAELLIEAGADVNLEWSDGATAICETTADQFYHLAQLLIAKGANVNVRAVNGLTPLMFAAQNEAAKCVDLFLDSGADINAVEKKHGVGAFGLALNRLDLSLAEHLLVRGAEPNFGSIETLPLAVAEHGSLAFIQALEARGCNLVRDDQRGRIAFVSARNSDPEVFDHLLNQGADPSEGNNFGYTPLILAALNNHHHLIRRYLGWGVDGSVRDVDGETALSLAIEKRHQESVSVLREFHVEECDYSSLSPEAAMLKAAEDGTLGSILNLRDAGIPLNRCDVQGNSPLMIAVRAGHQGVVRSLYHLGADINHRNDAGDTALSLAKAADATEIVNSLQEFGALDATTSEFAKFSAMFGGIPIYNAADTMFGRMSHPYKDKPPYDNEAADEDDDSHDSEADQDDQDFDESDEDRSDESDVGASIDSKLGLLSQVLDSDQVKEQLPEAVLEQLAQKLEYWRTLHEEAEFDDDELTELNRLLGMFGLGEKEEEAERTPLFEAVHAQDLPAVRKLIKSGADVNEVDGEGNTPLLIAVLSRQLKLVEELLKLGADPNKARPDGKGPLFGSVRVGDEQIAKILLKAGAEIDAPLSMEHNGTSVDGCTALYIAAYLGHLPSCKVLLNGGASLETANDLGYTPLMAAIQADHDEVIDFLLKSGANVNPEIVVRPEYSTLGGLSPLNVAAQKGNVAVVKKLIKREVDVNRRSGNGWTSLKSAAQKGSFDIVKALLDAGADPNIADDTNYTALMNAVNGEHESIVKILLKFKADPNVQSGEYPDDDDWEPGRSALMDAAVSGNVPIARELLKNGANPNLLNSGGRTALHSAVISKSTDMVALLLKSGADPNVFEVMSALDVALHRWALDDENDRAGGTSDVLELMLKKGLPSDRGSLHLTALTLLTEGHLEVVKLLRKHGFTVDPDYSKNGASELFITAAVGDDRVQAAELLLQIGADANFKSQAGLSVLSLAARNGAVRLSELLIKSGANLMDRNSANALAYDLAVIYGHGKLIDLLIAHMNQVVPAVDRQADDGTTAIMRATIAADAKTVKDLLAAGADAIRRDRQGESPLSYAVTHDLDEIVQILRAAGVERLPEEKVIGHESIVHAGSQGAVGTILDLLDSGAPIDTVDPDGDTALTAAAVHPGAIKVLAKRGADLSHRNNEGKTAYMIAAASKRILMMRVLEEAGSPIEEPEELDGLTQMHANFNGLKAQTSVGDEENDGDSDAEGDGGDLLMTCLTEDALTVSRQIAAGADVNYENEEGRTPLLFAIAGLGRAGMPRRKERDCEQIVDSLLAAGADPNLGPIPPLIAATTVGRLHTVSAILRAGADVDAVFDYPTNDQGGTLRATALFLALSLSQHGTTISERLSIALLEAEPNLSFLSDDESMASHWAANFDMSNVLAKILDMAPDTINAQDKNGSTPLMMACIGGHAQPVILLLSRGADVSLKDQNGLTAKDIAINTGNQALADLLA